MRLDLQAPGKIKTWAELMGISTAQAGVDGAELTRPRERLAKNCGEQAVACSPRIYREPTIYREP